MTRSTPDAAATVALISAAITASYPPGLDPELVMRRRTGKVGNEYGEVLEAIEGWTGENPRKGVYATRDDVGKELLDVAVAALAAWEHLNGDHGWALGALFEHILAMWARLSTALEAS